jgi:hypothetical protein
MERVWLSRLRWRMRGAWLWPAFVGLTVLEGAWLHARPISGEETPLAPALLLAGFLNLGAVAVIGPLLARVLRRRRRDLPRVVAFDYAGTALVGALALGLLVAGLVHHGAVVREHRAASYAGMLAEGYAMRRSPRDFPPSSARARPYRLEAGRLYRTCVYGPRDARPLCVVVHFDTSQPTLVPDGHEPNATYAPRGGY